MNIPPFTWIEIKEGNPLPELDEDVLFKFSNGNWGRFSLRILRLNSIIPATHWMKILQPEEMKNQKQEQ